MCVPHFSVYLWFTVRTLFLYHHPSKCSYGRIHLGYIIICFIIICTYLTHAHSHNRRLLYYDLRLYVIHKICAHVFVPGVVTVSWELSLYVLFFAGVRDDTFVAHSIAHTHTNTPLCSIFFLLQFERIQYRILLHTVCLCTEKRNKLKHMPSLSGAQTRRPRCMQCRNPILLRNSIIIFIYMRCVYTVLCCVFAVQKWQKKENMCELEFEQVAHHGGALRAPKMNK